MLREVLRARGVALVVASALAAAALPAGFAQPARIEAAQADADTLRKRADLVMKGVLDAGGKVTLGALVMAAFMFVMSNRASFKQMLGLSISVK